MEISLLVILPAFNETQVIGQVLAGLKKELKKFRKIQPEIIVVDDGSTDKTGEIAKKLGVKVLHHLFNRGLGAALKTGLEYARLKGFDLALCMDADGQHDPKDIKRLIKPILDMEADVVIGSRFLEKSSNMPWDRKIINKISNFVTFLFFGIYPTDSQSGFRAFSKKAISKMNLRTQKMEVSSEFFDQIKKHHLQFKEVPIKVIYTPYSRSKGQSNLNALNILVKLVLKILR